MFLVRLNEPRILNATVSVLSDFITEASFSFQKEGIKLHALDPANISMVILSLLPSAFNEYKVEQPVDITVNLEALKQALKRAKPTDPITLSLDKNKLKIAISGKSMKNFYIPLIEREGKERKVPALDFLATVELDSNEFRDYIEDASIAGDTVVFEADRNSFIITSGELGSKVSIQLTKGSDPLLQIAAGDNVRSTYSLDYLKKMARAATLAETVVVQFAKDYPLRLDFRSLNKAQMTFILAPRIENK